MSRIYKYIESAYSRWLDYAQFQAVQHGIPDEGEDLLNAVLLMLLEKDMDHLLELLSIPRGKYTALDAYVLRMIKTNSFSPTSPYRHKNKLIPRDANTEPWQLDLIDEEPEGESRGEKILRLHRAARERLAALDAPERHKELFAWKFFGDQALKDWPGNEGYTKTSAIYNQMLKKMKQQPNTAPIKDERPPVERLAVRLTKCAIFARKEQNRRLAVRLLHARVSLERVA